MVSLPAVDAPGRVMDACAVAEAVETGCVGMSEASDERQML